MAVSRSLRPTRRDLILVIISFTLGYLFFTAPDRRVSDATSRLKSVASAFTGGNDKCAVPGAVSGPLFENQVAKVGFQFTPGEDGAESDEELDEYTKMETKLLGHTPGWTMFEKLYIFNGQFWVLT
jgi:hypothetical protein